MKHFQTARHAFTFMGILAALAVGMGWMTPASSVEAAAKAFNLPRVYDFSLSSSTPGSAFATMHKTGEVNTDSISLSFSSKATTNLNLGPGHGTWKHNANTNKVIITTFHTDRDGSGKYWKVVQNTTPDDAGNLTGSVKIYQYASISASDPELSYQSLCTNEALK
ncbi:MAG: hypothetical protein IT366_15505 [Candidatus Hydrogenedentes bacterium]|nr:hypothetical protein [Candidatus Hydrogenedentota bacterium]